MTNAEWYNYIEVVCDADNNGATVYLDKCAFNSAGHDLTNIYLDSANDDLAVNQLATDGACYGTLDYSSDGMRYKFDVNAGQCGANNTGNGVVATLYAYNGTYSEGVYSVPMMKIDIDCTDPSGDGYTYTDHNNTPETIVETYEPPNNLAIMNTISENVIMQFQRPLSTQAGVALPDYYHLKFNVSRTDTNWSLMTDNCWIANSPDANDTHVYEVFQDSCPGVSTIVYQANRDGESYTSWAIRTSDFAQPAGRYWLHCQLSWCDSSSVSCVTTC